MEKKPASSSLPSGASIKLREPHHMAGSRRVSDAEAICVKRSVFPRQRESINPPSFPFGEGGRFLAALPIRVVRESYV